MINTLYLPEIREMLTEENSAELREFCTALHPARTADFMEGLTPSEAWAVLKYAELETRCEIFRYFDPAMQEYITQAEPRAEIAELITELAPDDRVDLLKDVEPYVVEELLPLIPTDERRDILRLRAFPEGTAGSVMTTGLVKLAERLSVGETLEELARQSADVETIYYLYVVDDEDHLRGVVSTRQLVSSMGKIDTRLSELMEADIVVCKANDDQEDVANKVARYDLLAIPVVDEERRILGIITYDDIIDVVREEATEDAHRIAAVEPLEESYLETPLLTLVWKRGMWLTFLFVAAILTAFVLERYENHLLWWPWLMAFVPLVISSGGNSGSQSSTLVITALTIGDITLADWWLVVRREFFQGIMLGGFLGLVSLVAAWYMVPEVNTFASVMVVPLTVLLVVICGTLSGSILPLVFKRLGLDPAMMSSPFVAGIIDILGIIIYMTVAAALLMKPL
jgi:magnesium transporter